MVRKQLKDYEVFEKVIISKEGRLDLHQPADSMYLYLSQLKTSLSKELSLIDQFKAYSKTLAKLGCGHTQIEPSLDLFELWILEKKSLPIDFILQGKRLFTNKLLSEDYDVVNMEGANSSRLLDIMGMYEILSLNHKTVPEMMNTIAPYISSDEDGIDFKYHKVADFFQLYRHMSDPFTGDSVQIQYVKGIDTISTYLNLGFPPVNTMQSRIAQSSEEDLAMNKETGTFEIKNSEVGVFRFRSFSSCSGAEYDLFLKRSFEKLKSQKIKKVIVDLRGNTGGAMQYPLTSYFVGRDVELGRYVVEKPKKLFDTRHISKRDEDYRNHKLMSRVQRLRILFNDFDNGIMRSVAVDESLIYDGDIAVITDEATFSSAALFACHLKTLCRAKIIGRPAGGSFYRGNAGSISAKMPNSKFILSINPNTFYSHLPTTSDPFIIKTPDILLEPGYIIPSKLDDFYINAAIDSFN